MSVHGLLLLALCLGVTCRVLAGTGAPPQHRPPNVIFILADDLGYHELGSYGQEKIRTPHLDRMAAEGLRFTQFYSGSPVCAPSRATLLTGRHTGHTYVRDNYELGGFRDDEERGQLPLPPGTVTLGTMLRAQGYATAAVGKWGLGAAGSTGHPNEQGFDYFYGYLDQKQAHNYYPTHLWRNAEWDTLRNVYFHPHQRLEQAPADPAGYERFKGTEYAADLMADEAVQFIRAHRDEPFFLYFAPPIPHVALQVPDEALPAYEFQETPYLGQEGYLPHPRPRAAYAAMITRLDSYVGQILALLDELDLDEHTLVMFSSDNGPTYAGGADYAFFDSNGPLRGMKGSVYEGGIRVPMLARWPGRIAVGAVTDHVSALWDVMPTLAALTGAAAPDGIDGISFLPTLLSQEGSQQEHAYLYWEHYGPCQGQQAVRVGAWKGVRLNVREDARAPLELYNLAEDPGERHNVAREHPDVVRELWAHLRKAHTPSEVERWNFVTAEQPQAAHGTPVHTCFPWNQ